MLKNITFILFFACYTSLCFSQENIIGYVYDKETTIGLPGVNIVHKKLENACTTNIDGKFTIKANIGDSLVFSFIGMKSKQEIILKLKDNKIFLERDNKALSEVLVIAYGKKKKSEFTGSSSTIDKTVLQNNSYASIDKLLQGKASGLKAITQSGDPNERAAIMIRGVGSLSASFTPLYILDGLAISEDQLVAINTDDIANINVLKDASAISIYGSRASNGVILINTKQAKRGKTKVSISSMYGVAENLKDKLNLMNAEEKLRYEVQLGIKNMSEEAILKKASRENNWKEEIFRKAVTHRNSIQISSGREKTSFLLSLMQYNKKASLQNSSIKKYISRLNINHKISDKFKVKLRTNIARIISGQTTGMTKSKIQKNNPIVQAYLNNPYDMIKDEDGNYLPTTLGPNAIEDLDLIKNTVIHNKLLLNLGIKANIYKKVYLESNFGVDYQQKILDKYNHPDVNMYKGVRDGDPKGDLTRAYTENYSISQSHVLHLPIYINKHKINARIGFESDINKSDDFISIGKGFASGSLTTLKAATKALSTSGNKTEMASLSYFSNINYSYMSKLFIDVSARRDAASMFGKNNKYANFYALGLAYNINSIIKNENIDFLKIRYSIGTTGNSNISAYAARSLYSFSNTYNNKSASIQYQLRNDNLSWEKSLSSNLGVDLSLLNNKINVSADIYKRTTSDLIFDYQLSRTTGFADIQGNTGEMVNKGIELSITSKNIKTKNFLWSSILNVSYNKNEITKLQNHKDVKLGFTILREGEAIGTLYQVQYAGVNPASGNPIWYNNDGIPTEEYNIEYAKAMKPGIPPLEGGLYNSLKYKNLKFSFNISFAYGNEILNNAKYFTNSDGEFSQYNQNKDLLYKQWKNVGDITEVPRQIQGAVNNQMSSKYVEDGSYIKLKNIEISYNLPKKIITKIACSSASIFIQANNVYTITKYTGSDPELAITIDRFRHPSARSINMGAKINF